MSNEGLVLGPFGEMRCASSTGVGQAITAGVTAAAAFTALPPGTQYINLEGRNYATAVVIKFSLNPWLTIIKTTDGLAAGANATDYSDAAQDGATTSVVMSSFATGHALWVGAELPFRGIFVDVNATNSNASTMAATYWSATGPTMASLSITDSTSPGTTATTLGQDGAISWTLPTDWTQTTLRTAGGATASTSVVGYNLTRYWVRFTVSAALDTSVTLDAVFAMNRNTSNYATLTSGRPGLWLNASSGSGRIGCIEASTDAGTANLLVNAAVIAGGRFTIP